MAGSGLLSTKGPNIPHLAQQGKKGVGGEVADLRADIVAELAPMAAIAVDEFTNPLTAAAAGLLVATASTVAVQAYTTAQLLSAGRTELAANPRNVTFTTAGTTPADAPATAVIVGLDAEGKAQTETVSLAQTATIASGVKAFKSITSITFAAGDGAGATVSIGYGIVLGLSKTPKSRAGLASPVREIAVGVAVTTGAISATNKTYTPSAAPNGTNDYAVYYEWDPTV